MGKNLNVCAIDEEHFLAVWDEDKRASYYSVVGMDDLFVNHIITCTTDSRIVLSSKDLKDYIRIHIQYILKDDSTKKEVVLETTNEWIVEKTNYQKIEIHCLESYHGYTLSFFSDVIFDKYRVYEKTEDGEKFIVESEDFQVNSNQFSLGSVYYVEGYKKIDNDYKLVAKSNLFSCKTMRVPKPQKKSLSIVVPIYNSELFLARALDSILFSTFKDKEIILVNDGSKDHTSDVIKWYEKKYKDLIISYSQEIHEGPSNARNIGLKYVQGDYVAFMDSDDMVHPYMYEKLFEAAMETKADVSIGKTLIRSDINENSYCLNVQKEENHDFVFYTFNSMFNEYNKNTFDNIFFVSVWHKIMKTDIARNHPFPTFNHYEDTAYTMTAYSFANSFVFSKSAYYMWDQRFRKTIGTYSTSYEKVSSIDLNKYFIEALFHVSKEGNPERSDYTSYYAVVELFNYLTSVNYDLYNNPFFNFYIEKIKELNSRVDLVNNPLIRENRNLLVFIVNILKM